MARSVIMIGGKMVEWWKIIKGEPGGGRERGFPSEAPKSPVSSSQWPRWPSSVFRTELIWRSELKNRRVGERVGWKMDSLDFWLNSITINERISIKGDGSFFWFLVGGGFLVGILEVEMSNQLDWILNRNKLHHRTEWIEWMDGWLLC